MAHVNARTTAGQGRAARHAPRAGGVARVLARVRVRGARKLTSTAALALGAHAAASRAWGSRTARRTRAPVRNSRHLPEANEAKRQCARAAHAREHARSVLAPAGGGTISAFGSRLASNAFKAVSGWRAELWLSSAQSTHWPFATPVLKHVLGAALAVHACTQKVLPEPP